MTLGLLVVAVALWTRGPARPTWAELAVWGVALLMTLMYNRTIAFGAVIAAPVVATAVASLVPPRPAFPRLERAVVGVAAACALALAAVAAPSVPPARWFPDELGAALDRLPPDTPVLNDYDIGSWLLWAHPGVSPYIDGRADVYSIEHYETYFGIVRLGPGWDDDLRDTGLSTALLRADAPLAQVLQSDRGWVTLDASEEWVLLESGPRS